jgi:hypothetical protein
MASATELDLPAVPDDVLEFARDQDITSGLHPLLAITRTVFPTAPIALRLEDDPEVPNDKHIVVEVDVSGWTVDEMFAAHNQWTQLFLKACSASDLYLFRLRLRQSG